MERTDGSTQSLDVEMVEIYIIGHVPFEVRIKERVKATPETKSSGSKNSVFPHKLCLRGTTVGLKRVKQHAWKVRFRPK